MLSLRAARERERESSLRTSSSFLKKSFTLIELSIVLLILSLLVGSLLVGRQIVDRAKIQRIIFEFDYYEKAFHQFYDTYRAVPGSLNYKECIKHAEFKGCACSRSDVVCMGGGSCSFDYDNQTWCQKHTPNASTNKKVIPNTSSGMWNNLVQLKKSGLISEIKYVGDSLNDLGDANKRGFFPHLSIKGSAATDVAHYALSSFDNNVLVGMKGYVKTEALTNWGFAKLHPEYYAKKLEGHNALFMEATKNSTRKTSKGVEYRVYGAVKAGAFSSKFLSQVDAKVDDGRPGSGRLLAIKNPYAEDVSDVEGGKICYDAMTTELNERTIYHNDNNQKYGCDVMYIMEDVK